MTDQLSAPYVLEYTYRRSLGPVLSRFFTGLRDGVIFGIQTNAGDVLVPPTEYDPYTGDSLETMVEVGPGGVVTSWGWVAEPRPNHPLDTPFAWALIRLDGATTAMLHVVDTEGDEAAVRTGTRVEVSWRAERIGQIQDIRCFVPVSD